jgi:hypothetical protein
MFDRLKYPLSIYVVWHPHFLEGKKIANTLYSIFCRDVEKPLSRGLGIPVFYRSKSFDKIPPIINPELSDRNAIVLLIDQNFFIDEEFGLYTESLTEMVDDNTRIFPVQLCDQATDFQHGISSFQFIRAYKDVLTNSDNFDFSMNKIKTELLHDCARLLMNISPTWKDKAEHRIPSPVKLFLSHAKKDGLEIAKRFKAFVDSELKLDVIFDTVSIADGYTFEKQIESLIEKSALIVFHTDEYSTREWCRIEILIAKRNKCSIVVVHDIKNGEKRAFPYMGNTPTMTLRSNELENFYEIINMTLFQILNNLFQLELLESYKEKFQIKEFEFLYLTSPPELFNFIDINKKKKDYRKRLVVLYPEPPLGAEELKILNELDPEIRFITPILLPMLI